MSFLVNVRLTPADDNPKNSITPFANRIDYSTSPYVVWSTGKCDAVLVLVCDEDSFPPCEAERILRDLEAVLLGRLRDRPLLQLSAESTLVCLRSLEDFDSELGPREVLLVREDLSFDSPRLELRGSRDLLRVLDGDRDLLFEVRRFSGCRDRDLSRSLEFLRSTIRALEPEMVSERDGRRGLIFSGETGRGRSKSISSSSMLNCRVTGFGRFIEF